MAPIHRIFVGRDTPKSMEDEESLGVTIVLLCRAEESSTRGGIRISKSCEHKRTKLKMIRSIKKSASWRSAIEISKNTVREI